MPRSMAREATYGMMPFTERLWHVAVNAVMVGCKPEYMPMMKRGMTACIITGDAARN